MDIEENISHAIVVHIELFLNNKNAAIIIIITKDTNQFFLVSFNINMNYITSL